MVKGQGHQAALVGCTGIAGQHGHWTYSNGDLSICVGYMTYIVSPLAGLGGGISWRPPAYSLLIFVRCLPKRCIVVLYRSHGLLHKAIDLHLANVPIPWTPVMIIFISPTRAVAKKNKQHNKNKRKQLSIH